MESHLTDAKCPRRLKVDDKLKPGQLLDRQVAGFFALEDTARILAGHARALADLMLMRLPVAGPR